ncbi:YdeI/OmpD-associated family protein [Profundibacter sp.]|uniref:YdeI/OmpD-associated family protein n=1 Tax=Profundibacter sp. TaxID=3101071 RepID=UPI003D13049A
MTLKRAKQKMPEFVADALRDNDLAKAYQQRPPYQRNDYLAWINRAVRDETKQKRLAQMLDELRVGDVYMKMAWAAPQANKANP